MRERGEQRAAGPRLDESFDSGRTGALCRPRAYDPPVRVCVHTYAPRPTRAPSPCIRLRYMERIMSQHPSEHRGTTVSPPSPSNVSSSLLFLSFFPPSSIFLLLLLLLVSPLVSIADIHRSERNVEGIGDRMRRSRDICRASFSNISFFHGEKGWR